MKSIAEARRKRVVAVGLLAEGLSYDEIARKAGYKHRGSAFRAVSKALGEQEVAEVQNLRDVELARLNALQLAHWDKAIAGDAASSQVILKVMRMRQRLLGLEGSSDLRDEGPQMLVRGS